MQVAKIERGRIANIIEVDPDNRPAWSADWPEVEGQAQIGWVWDGTSFSPQPEPTQEEIAAAEAAQKDETMHRIDVGDVERVLLKIAFLQENRLRSIESKPQVTIEQFKGWVREQL